MRVLHKVLNGRISLLRGHTTFQSANLKSVASTGGSIRAHIEASPLQSEGDQVEKRHKLRAKA